MNQRILISSEISAILRTRFGLTADVQVIPVKGENRTLYHLEHIPFSRRMTMAGLERLCRRIAKALDAELYGTVNVDFVNSGDAGTFAMMAEALYSPHAPRWKQRGAVRRKKGAIQ